LREKQPDLKVLYMSGYPGEFIERHGVSGKEQGYLQKPFSQEALALKTREVLDS
jgi:two-component system cell cycle sensor histidine kinase/response regulator CckA